MRYSGLIILIFIAVNIQAETMYDFCLSYKEVQSELSQLTKRNKKIRCNDAVRLCAGKLPTSNYKNIDSIFASGFSDRNKSFCDVVKFHPYFCEANISANCLERKLADGRTKELKFESEMKALCNIKGSKAILKNAREMKSSCANSKYTSLMVQHADKDNQSVSCNKSTRAHQAQELNTGSDYLLFVNRNTNLSSGHKESGHRCFGKLDDKEGTKLLVFAQFDALGRVSEDPAVLCTTDEAFFGAGKLHCKQISKRDCAKAGSSQFWTSNGPTEKQNEMWNSDSFKRYMATALGFEGKRSLENKIKPADNNSGSSLSDKTKKKFYAQYKESCDSLIGSGNGYKQPGSRIRGQ